MIKSIYYRVSDMLMAELTVILFHEEYSFPLKLLFLTKFHKKVIL